MSLFATTLHTHSGLRYLQSCTKFSVLFPRLWSEIPEVFKRKERNAKCIIKINSCVIKVKKDKSKKENNK